MITEYRYLLDNNALGKIPRHTSPALDSTVHAREGDWTLYFPSASPSGVSSAGPAPSMPMTTTPIANHNLIATAAQENRRVLDAIEDRIGASR